jgi:hypothetical protein
MDSAKSCTANFSLCADQPAENQRTAIKYATLGEAYGDETLVTGTWNDTIMLLSTTFDEELDLYRDISVTLGGGYGCGFSGPASYSIITGPLTVSGGTVIFDRIVIR